MSIHADDILKMLEDSGPLTGKELFRKTNLDEFTLWSACNNSDEILTRITGKRYLRLDAQVAGYARLSPSIMREFYGYTVIATAGYRRELNIRAEQIKKETEEISNKKLLLAHNLIKRLVESHEDAEQVKQCATFMIAGDVVYGMAHAEPRPESSTGELVKGSDLDIIVVTRNLPDSVVGRLDASVYDAKQKLLMNPAGREEIDYIIKDISRTQEQLNFNNFKDMIASKILDEALYLYGSKGVFEKVKRILADKGIPEKLNSLKKKAARDRKKAEQYLLNNVDSISGDEWMKLFYTKEEKEEIF